MGENLNPQEILKGVDIDRMMRTIDAAESQLKKAEGMPCVVLLGNTGTGKSTLMNSVLHGPENMAMERFEVPTEFGMDFYHSIQPKKACIDE